ncbi:hypothetical protein AN960_18155 [Bacillus sp. FJAT-25509]|uniref:GNAT family N-acetyltransferase n=1 Tax=Bacillus sp. FJAT-25509 TaxID=1712029 RepID=UPI0006FCF14E|nr:GNAT family N-acetyltransferase [Bacillus sp. FJAT-25509]KQL35443.1 hypothetical protein AN960_18155 [Bacillus sp. FJAT-25509]
MIYPYEDKYLAEILEVFNLNVPDSFDPSEIIDLKEYLKNYGSTYFVYIENERIVGACGYYFPETNLGGISWIFTDPKYKGKKIGSKLVKHCIDEIQMNSSITNIEVRTSQFANVFFEKMGFRTQLVKQDYWAKGYDLYAMTMPVLINNITLE